MSDRPTLFLIDGLSYIYRAFYAIRHLSSSKGMPTNAVYGFTQMLLKVLKDNQPDYVAIAWDSKAPSLRKQAFPEYKAQRPPMPDTLVTQIPYIRAVVAGYRIATLEMEGYEADDLIATVARAVEDRVDVVVITGDKDIFQIVDDRVIVYDTMKEKRFGVEDVIERFGVPPDRVVEVMGLSGDPVDNIPGVPGIGEKTAKDLIQAFGTIENLLARVEEVPLKRARESLAANAGLARVSRDLATLETAVPLPFRLEEFRRPEPDAASLRALFRELEFGRLLKDLPEEEPSGGAGRDYRLVTDDEALTGLIEDLGRAGAFAIDLETTALHPMRADLVGVSVAWQPGQAFYIPVGHRRPGGRGQLPLARVLDALKPLLEDGKIRKTGQNIKYDWIVLRRYGIVMAGLACDTMVASYLLNPAKHNHNLTEIGREYLDRTVRDFSDVVGTGQKAVTFDEVELDEARDYSCDDAEVTLTLSRLLLPKLEEEGLAELFDRVEMPLVTVLARIEMNGVRIDLDLLNGLSKEIDGQLLRRMERIYGLAGEAFNINSSQQLGRILFDKLKLPVIKKTKTGYSTDVDVLTRLADQHELPMEMLTYRNLTKLKSTYIDALPKLVHPGTGRVHTSYNQTVTATGRLSSSDPNLQNIPIRTEEGNRIRQAFVPEKGWVLLSADYSQIELRLLAHLSRDPTLVDAFLHDEDIHARTASEVFGVPFDQVTQAMRREAKVINFGILYGMSAYGLSQQLGVESKVAQDYIDAYFKKYEGVQAYIDRTLADVRERGFVTTLLHRRRYLPEILSPNASVRQATERMAVNTPLQGTAADIIKVAMIRIQDRIDRSGLAMKMIMQVHDELVFEVPEEELDGARALVREEMEKVVDLSIPLRVSVSTGRNWAEAH